MAKAPKANDTLKQALKAAEVTIRDPEYPAQLVKHQGMNYKGQVMANFNEKRIMKHADFSDMDLTGTDFSGFNLQGSVFRNTILTDTVFIGADLRWSQFINCDTAQEAIWLDEDGNNIADLREVAGLNL